MDAVAMKELITILKQHKIRITKARLSILKDFFYANGSLDLDHFLRSSGNAIDRSTVFRTLQLFIRKKIIYRVPASDNVKRYLLQRDEQGHTRVSHSSFICSRCGNVTPIDTVVAPRVRLPKGFKQQNLEIVINGLCQLCKHY